MSDKNNQNGSHPSSATAKEAEQPQQQQQTGRGHDEDDDDDDNIKNRQQQNECEFCGTSFASRNAVFKHLRDPSSTCGKSILESNEILEPSPSSIKKHLRKQEYQKQKHFRRTNRTGSTIKHTQHSLWIGDLPLAWTRHGNKYQRLRALLRAHLPCDVMMPWITTVVRKKYRSKAGNNEYLGFAIVAFRDEQECEQVQKELHGKMISVQSVLSQNVLESNNKDFANLAKSNIPPFRIKVLPATTTKESSSSTTTKTTTASSSGEGVSSPSSSGAGGNKDPPLIDQLRPLSTEELRGRYIRLTGSRTVTLEVEAGKKLELYREHDLLLEKVVAAYYQNQKKKQVATAGETTLSRAELHHTGCEIPISIRTELLSILQNLRWAVPNHRTGLTSERYLVLQTNVTNDNFYQDLRNACQKLMDWTDPDFYYSAIAVTKNFVASPHIDDRDRSFQYAVSLGDFHGGGQLCVDGLDENDGQEVIHVVDTQNRIARVDGRHIHWVRSWECGDRYSLIFYDTSDRKPTPVMKLGVSMSEIGCSDSEG